MLSFAGQVGPPAMAPVGATAAAAGVNPMSWVTLLYDYSQGTTMHGLPYITRGARFVIRRSVKCHHTRTDIETDDGGLCVTIFGLGILSYFSYGLLWAYS